MFFTLKSHRTVVAPENDRVNAHVDDHVNALVDDATKKFENMDNKLKVLIENLREQHASMVELNRCRFKTAKQVESFVVSTPLSSVVTSSVGVEKPVAAKEGLKEFLENAALHDDNDEKQSQDTSNSVSSTSGDEPTEYVSEPTEYVSVLDVDNESFMAVHTAVYNLSNLYNDQFNADLIQYAQSWEHTVSTRVNGLLIQYRDLHQHAMHYHSKVLGLQDKANKAKNTSPGLAEKLERNEIKKKGAYEARDTVGESLWLFIDETVSRAWKDLLPLLYKACHFDASLSDKQASLFANLNRVGNDLKEIGEDWGCDLEGRLDDLAKKHSAEIYTVENPFMTLKPVKSPKPKEVRFIGPEEEIIADEGV